ncbi:hypothetical protein ACQKMI_00375 [Lysinibacillus sp. NPDC097214]|uniref:hypothetical protein n=1 Tax=Lysinibacillus sp. NPDC097214 TaxID=3390584 RepID=UPI003CFE4702
MKWKQLIEEKIKQDVFIASFDNEDEVMDYVYKYFENFFAVDNADEYIELEKSDNKITFKVYNHQIVVKNGSSPSIQFKFYNAEQDYMDSLGQLYVPDMIFTYSGGTKRESFSDELLNNLLEKAFKGLGKKSGMQVLK